MVWLTRISLALMVATSITLLPANAQASFTELRIVGQDCFHGKTYSAGALRIGIFDASKAAALLHLAEDFEVVARRGNNAEIDRINDLRDNLYASVQRTPSLATAKRSSKDSYLALVPQHKKIVIFAFTLSGEDDMGVARTFVETNGKGRKDIVLKYYSNGECNGRH
jgi:hypothetical protein